MDKPLERSLSIIMDKSLEKSLSMVVGGYIFSFGAYLVWCFYFFYGKQFKVGYFFVIGLVFFAITAVYFFSYLLISYITSFRKVWTSFFLVLILTLLVFSLIPPTGNSIYKFTLKRDKTIKAIRMNKQLEIAKKDPHTDHKRMKLVEAKLNNSHEISNVANTYITELQRKPEFERKGNDKLRKKLNETIGNLRSKQIEKRNAEEEIIEIGKSNRDSSEIKINPKAANTDLDSLGQEIIFKVQIICSGTLLPTNSPKLKGFKNVWKYKDGGLYKYTVGNEKDLKSASELQTEVRRKGFSAAFVVAFKNGKRITVRDARKLLAAY
jgi:ABC-type multidrug transport system fused ATPase/permease subunit